LSRPSAFCLIHKQILENQRQAIEEVSLSSVNTIIATGAEAATQSHNHKALRNTGTIILIKRNRNALLSEKKMKNIRFVNVTDKDNPIDLTDSIFDEYFEITDYDKLADVTINNDGKIEECVEKVIYFIKNAKEKRT
jgi:shikimate kinase